MADSALKQQLTEDMKTAMRAKDKPRLGVIRLVLAAIKQREVDERIELDDTQVLAVLDKMVKQRRDSVKQYEDAGRQELADQLNAVDRAIAALNSGSTPVTETPRAEPDVRAELTESAVLPKPVEPRRVLSDAHKQAISAGKRKARAD